MTRPNNLKAWMDDHYAGKPKTKPTAYVWWVLSFFGILGLHRLYLGKAGTSLIWLFTGGLFGIGALIDLFTIGTQVDAINAKKELRQIRAATLAQTKA